jgi:site-specific DNA-cytosine methylase
MPTFASLFSGGGGTDIGALQAGYTPLWAVECDAAIAEGTRATCLTHR